MEITKINTIGACTAIAILLLCSLIFIFRITGHHKTAYSLAVIFITMALPLAFLLTKASQFQRPPIYYIQISLMLLFILTELFLDYIFQMEFRSISWLKITYVMIFFGATGGMIGIAALEGRIWMSFAVFLFLAMTALAFIQHYFTGN